MANELDNFRSKYPQYSDLSDQEIVEKLSAKYPEQYGDLIDKYKQQPPKPTGDQLVPAPTGFAGFQQGLRNVLLGKSDILPYELVRNLVFDRNNPSGVQQFTRGAVSGATLYAPQAIEALAGLKQQSNTVAGTVGEIAGMVTPQGATSKGIGLLTGLVKGAGLGAKVSRGAIAGGTAGFILPPEESWSDLKQRSIQAIQGAFIGGAVEGAMAGLTQRTSQKLAGTLKKDMDIRTSTGETTQMLKNIRSDFSKVHQDMVDKFGAQIDRLSEAIPESGQRTINARGFIDDMLNPAMDYDKTAKAAFSKVPGFDRLLKNPELAERLTLRESQDILNYVNKSVPKNIKINNFDLLNSMSELRAAQLDAFPEMSAVKQEYANAIQPYNLLKNKFKENNLYGAIANNFGGPEGLYAVKQLLPEETINKIGGIKQAQEALQKVSIKDVLGKLLKAKVKF